MNLLDKIKKRCNRLKIPYYEYKRSACPRILIKNKVEVVQGCDYLWVDRNIYRTFESAMKRINRILNKTEYDKFEEWLWFKFDKYYEKKVIYGPKHRRYIRVTVNTNNIHRVYEELDGKIRIDNNVYTTKGGAVKFFTERY